MTQSMMKEKDIPTLLTGIGDIAGQYDHFILDVWGVLHDGSAPFSGTIGCLHKLKDSGKQILLLSNTPNRNAPITDMLEVMGITRDMYDHIVTAGDSAHQDLKDHYQGKVCWYAGDRYAESLTAGLDLTLQPHHENADFMINAIHGIEAEERERFLKILDEACAKDLVMICANPDMVVQSEGEIKECPGTYALHYEQQGGTVVYHGKPHGPIYERAWDLLGRPEKGRIVAVGDSFHTDITGANGFGIDSVFNFAGIHSEELRSAEKRAELFASQPCSPLYCLSEFSY